MYNEGENVVITYGGNRYVAEITSKLGNKKFIVNAITFGTLLIDGDDIICRYVPIPIPDFYKGQEILSGYFEKVKIIDFLHQPGMCILNNGRKTYLYAPDIKNSNCHKHKKNQKVIITGNSLSKSRFNKDGRFSIFDEYLDKYYDLPEQISPAVYKNEYVEGVIKRVVDENIYEILVNGELGYFTGFDFIVISQHKSSLTIDTEAIYYYNKTNNYYKISKIHQPVANKLYVEVTDMKKTEVINVLFKDLKKVKDVQKQIS
jgi:hypothetical protein